MCRLWHHLLVFCFLVPLLFGVKTRYDGVFRVPMDGVPVLLPRIVKVEMP